MADNRRYDAQIAVSHDLQTGRVPSKELWLLAGYDGKEWDDFDKECAKVGYDPQKVAEIAFYAFS